jgi:diacylglycerol kinase
MLSLKQIRLRRKTLSLRSFKNAFSGIAAALKSGHNIRFMVACLILIIPVCILLGLSALEWAVILLCCAGVISLELMNTAIESAVDIKTSEFQPLAKKAKDVAAGAVLVFSLFSAAIGLIIFIPHILAVLR